MFIVKGYKDNLTEENKADIVSLFEAVYTARCEDAEHRLLAILEKLIKRNPEDKPVNKGDFSLIMLLTEAFDDEYRAWLETTGKPFNTEIYRTGKTYLLSCFPKKKRMEQLLEETFLYLEQDFYKPQDTLLKATEEYRKSDNDEINQELSLTPSHIA